MITAQFINPKMKEATKVKKLNSDVSFTIIKQAIPANEKIMFNYDTLFFPNLAFT